MNIKRADTINRNLWQTLLFIFYTHMNETHNWILCTTTNCSKYTTRIEVKIRCTNERLEQTRTSSNVTQIVSQNFILIQWILNSGPNSIEHFLLRINFNFQYIYRSIDWRELSQSLGVNSADTCLQTLDSTNLKLLHFNTSYSVDINLFTVSIYLTLLTLIWIMPLKWLNLNLFCSTNLCRKHLILEQK